MSEPHDAPSAAELLGAVREFLEDDVMAVTEGRVQFHTRVAINVLATVERELALGSEQTQRHSAGLARLDVDDDAALARSIRSGQLDERLPDVARFVRATVEEKLRVANPGYLQTP